MKQAATHLSLFCLFALSTFVILCSSQPTRTEYDFIVVGAGTAGGVVAGRLGFEKDWTTLLIEEGGDDMHPAIWDHTQASQLLTSPWIERGYVSVPQIHANNRTFDTRATKVLGGTNTHNGNGHVIGGEEYWDYYAQILNDDDWEWKRVKKARKELKKYIAHTKSPDDTDIIETIADSYEQHGFPFLSSYNDGDWNGVSTIEWTNLRLENAFPKRETTFNAYVRPQIREAKEFETNIEVAAQHRVEKVLFDNNNNAIGVQVFDLRMNMVRNFTAKKEVILCAGSYNSPKILMLSGIGPADELEKHGIPLRVNLTGTGKNLRNDARPWLFYNRTANFTPLNYYEPARIWGFGPTGTTVNGRPRFHVKSLNGNCEATPLQKKSSGTVTLASADPADDPIIDPNMLSVPSDMDEMIAGVRLAVSIFNGTGIDQYLVGPPRNLAGVDINNDSEMEEWVRENIAILNHPTGTCSFGLASDPLAVVDSDLKVFGVNNLRVGDTSVLSEHASQTNGVAMVVGWILTEKIYDEY